MVWRHSCINAVVHAAPAALAAAALVLAACSGEGDDKSAASAHSAVAAAAPTTDWRTGGYADDADCTACHREIAQSFTTVAMSRTLLPADGAPLIEDLDQVFHHEPSHNFYQMKRSEQGEYTLRRWQEGPDGKPINILEQTIDYLIGSGNHVRVYTYKTPANELYQMPVVWFAQKQQWGMAPGFDQPNHFDFTRPIQRDCIFCHNPDPGLGEVGDRYGQPYVFPHEFSAGIGCQRCHGPGAKHIELGYDQNASLESVRASIVNPAKLSPRLSDDVCLQCHLQPTSERTSILRTLDHGDFSFRPGERLADHIVHIDFRAPDARAERFEANHHGYRMMQSPCFVESGGAMQCITCHDPHHTMKEPLAAKQAHYRNACLSCHREESCTVSDEALAAHAHIAAEECITCHMPPKRPGDAPHVLLTDHKVAIHPMSAVEEPLFVESFPEGAPDARIISIFRRDDSALSTEERIYLALAGLKSGHGYDAGEFAALVEELDENSLDADLYLADMYRDDGQLEKAATAYRAILGSDPEFAYARQGLARVLLQQGKTKEAVAEAERLIVAARESPDAHELLGTAYLSIGRVKEAILHYEEAVKLRPLFTAAHFNLASAHAMAGDLDRAAAHYARVAEIDPSQANAYARRGEILRADGKVAEAIRFWRHGATMAREDVELHILLAETLLTAPRPEDRNIEDGLRLAECAIELISRGGETSDGATGVRGAGVSPDSGRGTGVAPGMESQYAQLLRAFGLFASGRNNEARAAAREAGAQSGAASFDGAIILALIEKEEGNPSAGQRMYQRALAFPDAAQAISQPTPLRSALLSLARRSFGQ